MASMGNMRQCSKKAEAESRWAMAEQEQELEQPELQNSDSGRYSLPDGEEIEGEDFPHVVAPPNRAAVEGGGNYIGGANMVVHALPNSRAVATRLANPHGLPLVTGMSCTQCRREQHRAIRHYLHWSILMVCLAPPFGVIALVSSLRARRLLRQDPCSVRGIKESQMAYNSIVAGMLCMVLVLFGIVTVLLVEGLRLRLWTSSANAVPVLQDSDLPTDSSRALISDTTPSPRLKLHPDPVFLDNSMVQVIKDPLSVSKTSRFPDIAESAGRSMNELQINSEGVT